MAQGSTICLTLLFTWLLCSVNTVDWQGSGNMSKDNTTFIWNYINSSFTYITFSDLTNSQLTYFSDFAQNISTQLNRQWDPAWNVFIIYLADLANSDSVLYGYAFRDHWMWFNGIMMNDGYYVSFIIWKDYNCNNTWHTLNQFSTSPSNYQQETVDGLDNYVADKANSVELVDIWKVAQTYSQGMEKNPNFPDSAFTVIASQSSRSYHFARFCSVGYYLSKGNLNGNFQGKASFLQIR